MKDQQAAKMCNAGHWLRHFYELNLDSFKETYGEIRCEIECFQ